MVTEFDCVITYHHNIHTCGVARFNRYLADHLKIPMLSFTELGNDTYNFPLISIKESEMLKEDVVGFYSTIERAKIRYSIVLHHFEGSETEIKFLKGAEEVMALNAQMASEILPFRADVITGFTVATPLPKTSITSSIEIKMITFGMAHKIQSSGYIKIANLLNNSGRTSVLEISSALHEGTEFDDRFFNVGEEISEIFDGRVEFLGFLADYEVARRVKAADVMLAFFPNGARENNNSVLSAMWLGTPVITNLDSWSPSWLRHGETVFDISRLDEFPSKEKLKEVGEYGRSATKHLTYQSLVSLFQNT
jgi:hypothetical protein